MPTDRQFRSHGAYVNDYHQFIVREGKLSEFYALQMVKDYYAAHPEFSYNENTYFLNKCFLFTHCSDDDVLTGVYNHDGKWYKIGASKSAVQDYLRLRGYLSNPLP